MCSHVFINNLVFMHGVIVTITCIAICEWIYLVTECGLAPTVNLICSDRSIRVNWDAPGCQQDCKAYLNCENGTASNFIDKVVG